MASVTLKSGEIFYGISFGADKSISGEVVFQTGMVGYPESLTDPSYKGQILVLTYPIIGNYGIASYESKDDNGIPLYFESNEIQISGLICGEYSNEYHHWNSNKSLSTWLKESNIPAIYDIDTRELTKIIRNNGSTLGYISIDGKNIVFYDPNEDNLVAQVCRNNIQIYNDKGKINMVVIDCGIKYNQLRMLLKRDIKLTIVPYDYNFLEIGFEIDRLFISNGPGDPRKCGILINNLRKFMDLYPSVPIFGICLGHQILSLAIGANIFKLKYGNRGHNIPCKLIDTEYCALTSQNHGYAVDNNSLPNGWIPLFINANDDSNEGIYHESKPYYSVQFHPEANAGPRDTEYMFDLFIENRFHKFISDMREKKGRKKIKKRRKILILGSGALSIGQAGEFDYSGSQAIKAYKEEGIFTVLINPNIAAVQTSSNFVDKIYYLPITADFVEKVIENEHPDCISLSFGGQTALNCGIELYKKGIFLKYGIDILGTPIETIIDTEDRQKFINRLAEVNEKCAPSITVLNMDDAIRAGEKLGYPLLVRAAYALGGLGSGFVNNKGELEKLLEKTFTKTNQVIIDKSLKGWKEIEYEIIRDQYDNTISICNMENIDPLGIHTGESIVVAPSQTLTNDEYNMLRSVAIKTIKNLGVIGECNIQYALDPLSMEYYIIEINARLSRSSALASKATGYPLAYISAKLGLGYSLLELKNTITKSTTACFEPSLDYCVIKVPYWDLNKFPMVNKKIGSAMKSIGEVMAISRGFEEAFQKALRMTGIVDGFDPGLDMDESNLVDPSYNRILGISTVLYTNKYTVDELYELTKIDKWFLYKFKKIIDVRKILETSNECNKSILLMAKKMGFSDNQISKCIRSTEIAIRNIRKKCGIFPFVKQIDTVAGEFPCFTNYLYLTYHGINSDITFDDKNNIIVLGSGVYKIGSSVEFDWCIVNCIRRIREQGYKSIMINCNPETVSTDYDEADRLYFDVLNFETIMDIYEIETPFGIILSMGGQIPNNVAMPLHRQRVKVIGTSPDMIDNAENRYKFSRLLDYINIDQPLWKELVSVEEAIKFCREVQYPCLIRPSYVLSGASMNVAHSDEDLREYLKNAKDVSKDHPVVISKYIMEAKEIEVDAIARAGEVIIYAISEHVENAGVHSGDATLILPPQDLTEDTMEKIKVSIYKIAKELLINGPFNIQFIAKDDKIKVIECNLRASRSFPFVSKTYGVNFAKCATDVMLGIDSKYKIKKGHVCVKVPKFSFDRLDGADSILGVEMMSTGEVACFGNTHFEAYLKALIATGFRLPRKGGKIFLSIGRYGHKREFLQSVKILRDMGYELYASQGTADFYGEYGIIMKEIIYENVNQDIIIENYKKYNFDLIINISMNRTPKVHLSYGYLTRRTAIDLGIPLITDIKCAKLLITSLSKFPDLSVVPYIDSQSSYNTIRLPGLIDIHVHVREPGDENKETWETCTRSALAGGITTIFAMPNTNPAVVDKKSYNIVKNIASNNAYCNYGIYFGASDYNTKYVSKICNEMEAIGMKMYLNQTYGPLILSNISVWMDHIKNWNSIQPICVHAEMETLAAIIHIANLYRKKIHICHVSHKEEIELIVESKKQGIYITCEVSPHHLFLVADFEFPNNLKNVKPCLGNYNDQKALWDNLDYIDCFATDHAPHMLDDKIINNCPGFPGLETALPLLLTAVSQGRLTLDDIILRYHHNPCKIFNITPQSMDETYIEVDMDKEWIIPNKMFFSKCNWTPFSGQKVKGYIRRVVLNKKTVYIDGEIMGMEGKIVTPNVEIIESDEPKVTTIDINENKGDYIKLVLDNLISVDQFNKDMLRQLFKTASDIKKKNIVYNKLDGKLVASIFYEPSTRTSSSFNAAVQKMGGKIIEIKSDLASVKKGESIQDTIQTLQCYCDMIILRSPKQNDIYQALKVAKIPIINAGNGDGEHPTQALLDIYTIREEKGTVNGLTITFFGDLKYSRTVHSLIKLLALYNVRINYVSPEQLKLPNELILDAIEQNFYNLNDIEIVLQKTDILYVTRIQKERFSSSDQYNDVIKTGKYKLTPQLLTNAKSDIVIMHPLPRVDEISYEVDDDPRAAYFRQMENGLYIRMALLNYIRK